MSNPVIVDLDDLVSERQIVDHLVPLREAVPDLRVTCYAVPNLLGPVHDLVARYPWVTFAQHGWTHTFAECRAWTESDAHRFIGRALTMGYAPLFKPPNWIADEETWRACAALDVVLHHHKSDEPHAPGLRVYPGLRRARSFIPKHTNLHTHILQNPITDWIGTHPGFKAEALKRFTEFWTPADMAMELGA